MNEREALERHPFAAGLSDPQISALLPCARRVRYRAGAVIFREGAAATSLYLIITGGVALEQHVPGKGDLALESLGPGDLLGLSWIFPGGHWLLTARATTDTDALELNARDVLQRMDLDPALGFALSKHLVAQLCQRLERVRLQRLDVYRAPK
ncbi:MAG: cyclic nucleotide-binding domain-containing protein [Polyangiaceae bacterium]|nr:cyclic nucleotide-binding domain-containing protein [Polyangiaceae bacterium]